jgi:hypothetical protein
MGGSVPTILDADGQPFPPSQGFAKIWICDRHRKMLAIREVLTLGHDGSHPCDLCGERGAEPVGAVRVRGTVELIGE